MEHGAGKPADRRGGKEAGGWHPGAGTSEKSRAFKALLEKDTGLPVVLWDERRSSIEAHAILHAAGKKERVHRKSVDAVAASLILEGYLGSR